MRASLFAVVVVVVAVASCRSCDACVDAADDTGASDEKLPSPWPVTTTSDALQPLTVGRGMVRAAVVPQSNDDVAHFFEAGLAKCKPARGALGDALRVACETSDGESSVLLLPMSQADREERALDNAGGGPDAVPAASSRILARWQRPKLAAVPVSLAPVACGPALRFLAPPPSTTPRFAGASASHGDEGELGTCAFLTSLDAGDALRTMAPLVFKTAPVTQARARDGRYVLEGFEGGVYWRIDTARAVWKPATATPQKPVVSSVLVTRWDPKGASVWPANAKADPAARVANLEKCTQPCAADLAKDGKALLEKNDAVGLTRWSTLAQRCEYACDGEPGAPPGVVAAAATDV